MWGKKNLKYNHNRLVERSVHTNLEHLAAHKHNLMPARLCADNGSHLDNNFKRIMITPTCSQIPLADNSVTGTITVNVIHASKGLSSV